MIAYKFPNLQKLKLNNNTTITTSKRGRKRVKGLKPKKSRSKGTTNRSLKSILRYTKKSR